MSWRLTANSSFALWSTELYIFWDLLQKELKTEISFSNPICNGVYWIAILIISSSSYVNEISKLGVMIPFCKMTVCNLDFKSSGVPIFLTVCLLPSDLKLQNQPFLKCLCLKSSFIGGLGSPNLASRYYSWHFQIPVPLVKLDFQTWGQSPRLHEFFQHLSPPLLPPFVFFLHRFYRSLT